MDQTLNSYDEFHAAAYKLLNLTANLLGENFVLLQPVRWKWNRLPKSHEWNFIINYKGFTFFVVKNDRDMFSEQWYQSAAEEISAWLLLQRGVSKTKSEGS